MTATVAGIHLGLDTHANRPAANTVPDGSEYSCSTHKLVYKSNYAGNSWATYMDISAVSGFANPMTTAEDIIVGGASGAPTRKAVGSNGTFLGVTAGAVGYTAVTDALLSTSDVTTNNATTSKHGFLRKLSNTATEYMDGTGAWSTPAGGGGGGGGLVLLEQHTASASASLDFTTFISSTYDDYQFEFVQIVPATNNVTFECQVGTGGGPTYDTGTNYQSAGWFNGVGDSLSGRAGGSLTFGRIADNITTTANWSVNGRMTLYAPGSATYKNWLTEVTAPVTNQYHWSFASVYLSTTALTAVRFLMSSGNIASGIIRAYGIEK